MAIRWRSSGARGRGGGENRRRPFPLSGRCIPCSSNRFGRNCVQVRRGTTWSGTAPLAWSGANNRSIGALARVDGLSQRLAVQKVRFLEIHARRRRAFFLGGGPAFDAIQLTARISLGSRTSTTCPICCAGHAQSPCATRRRTLAHLVDSGYCHPAPTTREFRSRSLCAGECE